MTKLIPAKCPSCAANLEFPEGMELGHCMHCGAKVIIDREVHVHGQTAIACPYCGGKGKTECKGQQKVVMHVKPWGWNTVVESCNGSGTCNYHSKPENDPTSVRLCSDGKCNNCHGTGKSVLRKCEFCGAAGLCPACKGTKKCVFCNGMGYVTCTECKGTGFKIYKA